MNVWLQALGFIVGAGTIWQYYLMGHKHPWSFPVATIGWLLWDYYLIVTDQWGILPSSVICTALSIRGWVLWRRDGKGRTAP